MSLTVVGVVLSVIAISRTECIGRSSSEWATTSGGLDAGRHATTHAKQDTLKHMVDQLRQDILKPDRIDEFDRRYPGGWAYYRVEGEAPVQRVEPQNLAIRGEPTIEFVPELRRVMFRFPSLEDVRYGVSMLNCEFGLNLRLGVQPLPAMASPSGLLIEILSLDVDAHRIEWVIGHLDKRAILSG